MIRLTVPSLGLVVLALSLSPAQARAGLVFSMQEVGSDVVLTATGTVNTAGLTSIGGWGAAAPAIIPDFGRITTSLAIPAGTLYTGLSGPTNFGNGSGTKATSFSGDPLWLAADAGLLGFPSDYMSGDSLSASMTFANTTLSNLGVTPGTYTWTWGTGADADFAELQIGPAAVPEPSTLVLLGTAGVPLGVGAAYRLKKRARAGAKPKA